MALLLFDEVAVALPDSGSEIPFSLPKSLVRRYVKVYEVVLSLFKCKRKSLHDVCKKKHHASEFDELCVLGSCVATYSIAFSVLASLNLRMD